MTRVLTAMVDAGGVHDDRLLPSYGEFVKMM